MILVILFHFCSETNTKSSTKMECWVKKLQGKINVWIIRKVLSACYAQPIQARLNSHRKDFLLHCLF